MLNDPPHALLNTPTATAPLPCETKCLFGLQRRRTKYYTIRLIADDGFKDVDCMDQHVDFLCLCPVTPAPVHYRPHATCLHSTLFFVYNVAISIFLQMKKVNFIHLI